MASMRRSFVAHPAVRKSSTFVGEEIFGRWLCFGMAVCGVELIYGLGCPGGRGGEGVVVWGCIVELCFEYKPFGGFRGET